MSFIWKLAPWASEETRILSELSDAELTADLASLDEDSDEYSALASERARRSCTHEDTGPSARPGIRRCRKCPSIQERI